MEKELKEMKTKLDSMKRRKKEIEKELIELGVNVQKKCQKMMKKEKSVKKVKG